MILRLSDLNPFLDPFGLIRSLSQGLERVQNKKANRVGWLFYLVHRLPIVAILCECPIYRLGSRRSVRSLFTLATLGSLRSSVVGTLITFSTFAVLSFAFGSLCCVLSRDVNEP